MALSFAVLLGSVRRDRMGIRAARFVVDTLKARGHDVTLVDPVETALPLLDPMYKEYPAGKAPAVLQRLAGLYKAVDGFVVVSAEYNHSIPPALSNLLDHFLEEYFWRPSLIVTYSGGSFGGVRAAMQLRAMLGELGMPSIPSLLPIARIGQALSEAGIPAEARLAGSAARAFAEFEWYARALAAERARAGTPY